MILLSGIGLALGGCSKPIQHQAARNLPYAGKFRALAVEDLDNDGHPDVIAGGASPGTVVIWYGDGTGVMKDHVFLPLKADVRSVAVADFIEDGLKDIAISVQREASGIMLWENRPERKWEKANEPITINNYEGIRAADINRDGHMDIIAANYTSDFQGGIQVWQGDGKGGWSPDRGPTVTGLFMDVAVADMNGDGNLDLIGAGWGTYGALRVWLGNGFGGWLATSQIYPGDYNKLSLSDVNGDGNLDILVGTYREGIRIFPGRGDGAFGEPSDPLEVGSFWQVLPVDLNDDGRTDIVAGSIDEKGLVFLKNRGAGGWGRVEKKDIPTAGTYYDMVAADLNRDGFLDICMAGFGNGIQVYMGLEGEDEWKPGVHAKGNAVLAEGYLSQDTVFENSVFKTINGEPLYRIGPGDLLDITLWKGKGVEADRFSVTVRQDGNISLGLVEDLMISGLTALELDQLLTERFSEYIKIPRIDVLVVEKKSKIVSIIGPGAIVGNQSSGQVYLEGRETLSQILSRAGRLNSKANLSRVRLQQRKGQSLTVDMYKIITLGETGRDPVIEDGDLIYVPVLTEAENRVYVFGEVRNPGAYAFVGSEFKILDAIISAGGVSSFSIPGSTKIVRGDPRKPEVLSTDLSRLMKEGDLTQNVALQNGDFVFVPRSFIGDINEFLRQIQPILSLAYTPKFVLDIPISYDEAYDDADEILRGTNEDDNQNP